MHVRPFLLPLGFVLIATVAVSQDQPVVRRGDGSQAGGVIRRPDGGAYGPMQSIFIPPKPGAPFSLILGTEWTRVMANGGTFTLVNERHVVRDSKGRIYQER